MMKKNIAAISLVLFVITLGMTPFVTIAYAVAQPSASSRGCSASYTSPQSLTSGISAANWFDYPAIPYQTASVSRFPGTLVTYVLPPQSAERYASVVASGNSTTVYLFSSDSDVPVVYSHSHVAGQYQSVQQSGNFTVKDGAIGNVVSLPGGYNDPTISGYQLITYSVGGIVFETEAYATFNYQSSSPYYITGVGPAGSGAWVYAGWQLCTHSQLVGPTGVTISYVQMDAGAVNPGCPFATAVQMYPIVQYNTYTGQLTYGSHPYNSWFALTCYCVGVSWSFPAPP